MEVFAVKGYDNGSTQEIVHKAGISKGLLFHYFGTKKDLFLFLFDYSFRVLQLEVRSNLTLGGEEYFALLNKLIDMEASLMVHYPYMIAFLESASNVKNPELGEMEEKSASYRKLVAEYLEKADIEGLRPDADPVAMGRLIHMVVSEVRRGLAEKGMLEPIAFKSGIHRYLDMLVKLSKR